MTTKWSEAAVSEAIESAAKAMGYDTLKPEQKKAVSDFVNGRDVFVALPTGFGKSVCYGCLPVVYDILRSKKNSIVIVVSPLVAIMKDQVSTFTSKGIQAACVISDISHEVKTGVEEGQYQLVFFSPEQLLARNSWRSMLRTDIYWDNLVAFAVDEAHCVKKW